MPKNVRASAFFSEGGGIKALACVRGMQGRESKSAMHALNVCAVMIARDKGECQG